MPAINRSRSLSPSLLSNAPHRYIPYSKINSTYSFGIAHPQIQGLETDTTMRSSPESYACSELGKLNLSESAPSTLQRNARSVGSVPRHPAHRTMPNHRRAVSLSSVQHSQAYILVPRPHPQTQTQTQGVMGGTGRRIRVPHPLTNVHRHPSPPMTPIVESPIPCTPRHRPTPPAPAPAPHQAQTPPVHVTNLHFGKGHGQHDQTHHQRQHHHQAQVQAQQKQQQQQQQHQHQQQLMLVTPTLAAYLQKGGSVNVKAADGKSWKIRAPHMSIPSGVVGPTCGSGMRMMRM